MREVTRAQYETYLSYWDREFGTLEALTSDAIAGYVRKRLRVVRGKTVRSEVSALRQLCRWLVDAGELDELPVIPAIKHSVEGTPWKQRRRVRAPEYSPEEIEAVLAALPEESEREGWHVRARFVVAYETCLRPATLDKLSCPENYRRGAEVITLTDADDKEAFGRELPLTKRAQEALKSVCPKAGLIFGAHRYRYYVGPAALKALGPGKGSTFTAQHFRSAAMTHWLDAGVSITAVQYMAGHKHTSTTSKYVRPSFRAAAEAMLKRG